MKTLRKSNNRMLCGVCAGIAEFFNIDPTIIRLLMAAVTIFGWGSGIVLYIIAALIMPDKPAQDYENLKRANVDDTEDGSGACARDGDKTAGARSDEEFNSYFKK